MRRTLPYLGVFFLICTLVLTSLYLTYQDLSFLNFDRPSNAAIANPSFSRILVLIVSTLLGITAGYLHTRLQGSLSSRFNFNDELEKMFHAPDYYRALFASPIVFSVVYLAVNQQPDDVVAFLLAFENGFFWNRVLERRMHAIEVKNGPERQH